MVPSAVEVPRVQQSDADGQLVSLWLHGRSPHTQRAYRADVDRFLAFVARPLPAVTLGDLQAFADSLEDLAPSSRARTLAAIKSLLAFGQRTGYLPLNVGAALKLPTAKNTLAERILSETQVHRLLALEPNHRNQVLLRLLYVAGLRVSELAALKWRDLQPRDDAGQVTIFGKGQKTRVVLLPIAVWRELERLGRRPAHAPVFASRRGGGHLHPTAVERVVWRAARRAGIEGKVSPHWLRHAHATHALDRGAPIHLVQATLGHASVATTGRYLHARPTDSSARYLVI
ncbi:MAG: tyrosine-type recombinase/integrase [Chloroflexi bacterium]|nr:tyrosine-type recombinase/integrase [Chloroflexota bacterium]